MEYSKTSSANIEIRGKFHSREEVIHIVSSLLNVEKFGDAAYYIRCAKITPDEIFSYNHTIGHFYEYADYDDPCGGNCGLECLISTLACAYCDDDNDSDGCCCC